MATSSTYTTSSADSLVIYYLATADIPSSSFLVVSGTDYTISEINPIGEFDPDEPSSSIAEETSEPESVVGLVVATVIIVLLMACIGSMA